MLLGMQLYRQLLKEARRLPHPRTSEHYTDRIRSEFRREHLAPESSRQAVRRVQRAQKLLRQLQAANDGYLHALRRAVETAHGVRGKGKHAALQPFRDLGLFGEKGTKYSFPPALAALVTSPVAHTSRAPTPAQLLNPPTLPPRADPNSEEARLLGTLIPQRVRAIKRRYWNAQTGKIRAPIAIRVETDGVASEAPEEAAAQLERYTGLDVSAGALETGWKRLDELVAKTWSPFDWDPLPPRRLQSPEDCLPTPSGLIEQMSLGLRATGTPRVPRPALSNTKWHQPKTLTPRLLRRRMQEALAQAPVVSVKIASPAAEGKAAGVKYEVARHESAKGESGRWREQTDEEAWWQEQAAKLFSSKDSAAQGESRPTKKKDARKG